MEGLRCLDLSYTEIKELPADSVANVCNLGTLLLKRCRYLEFIHWVGKLTKLRDLNLSCTEIKELSEGVEELINLEYLDITQTKIQNIPEGLLCKLCKLESFLGLYSLIKFVPKELTSLRPLVNFEGRIYIDDFDALKQFVGSEWFVQLKMYSIVVRMLHSNGYVSPWMDYISQPARLRHLAINGCRLSRRREVCFKVPHSVNSLALEDCSFGVECLLEALPSLCSATELQFCRLERCRGIKYIVSDAWLERGERQVSTPVKGVQQLRLVSLDDFVGLYEGDALHPHIFFGGLRVLTIMSCPRVKKIWLQNDILPNLESIQVDGCENMEQVFATAGTTTISSLKSIEVSRLSELKSICGNNVFLPCLERVMVSQCPKLEKLWLAKDELPNLKDVFVCFCGQMKEVFATTKWPKVYSLTLIDLPELRSICTSVVCFPELQNVSVRDCQKLKKLNHYMPSLRKIEITGCEEMEEIFERGDDAIQMPNLEEIFLADLPELRSICRKAIVCNSIAKVTNKGEEKLEICPISVPMLLLANNNPPFPMLEALNKPRDWWNSLYWNDPATKLAFDRLGCLMAIEGRDSILYNPLG